MSRKKARVQAFHMIFQKNFSSENSIDEMVQDALDCRDEIIDDYSIDVLDHYVLHVDEINDYLEKYSQKWKLNRLNKVTLSILQLAVTEILFINDVNAGIAINEAVELAKEFATKEDASYINGVLGGFVDGEKLS